MRTAFVVLLLTLFFVSGWGVAAGLGQENETEARGWTTVALDLMDLEIPGEGGEDEMELPPIQGAEPSEVEAEPPAPSREPAEVESSPFAAPEVSRSVYEPAPGLSPFLLEEPAGVAEGAVPAGTRAGGAGTAETPTEEFSYELKTVSPPPAHGERLKLPSGMETSAAGSSDVPEIPLLKGEERGYQVPEGQDASLKMKPFPDLSGTAGARRGARVSPQRRRPEDSLQVHEEMDARLIDLYERYYKDR